MRRLPNTQLTQNMARRMASQFFVDVAYILSDEQTGQNDYGQPEVETRENEIKCSFTDKPKAENWRAIADVESIDAEIRWIANEGDEIPNKSDRVRIEQHFENGTYKAGVFEIIDIRDRGTFGYMCALRKVKI